MIIDLPSELLHAIVETLHTRSTLTSLCRVSKAFNRAFTPFLYQQIVLDGYNLQWLKLIAGFQLGSHLQFTKELEIVVESTWTPGMKDVADNLSICLVKMTRLMTLTIPNLVGENDFCAARGFSLLEAVAKHGTLLDLTLGGTDQQLLLETMPVFTNLRKLSLHSMTRLGEGRHSELAKMLVSSPHLRHLGLSVGKYMRGLHDELYRLILAVSDRKSDSKLPLLRLEVLDLGRGYLPVLVTSHLERGVLNESTYLSQLTHLESLRSLKLGNDPREDPEMHAPLLYSATNILHLNVFFLGQSVLDLIVHLHQANPATLTSLAFTSLRWPNYDWVDMPAYVDPVPYLQFGWKRLTFMSRNSRPGPDCINDFVRHCEGLEYLSCPSDQYSQSTLSQCRLKTKRLRTIVIASQKAAPQVRARKAATDRVLREAALSMFRENWKVWAVTPKPERASPLEFVEYSSRVFVAVPTAQSPEGSHLPSDPFYVEHLSWNEARAFMGAAKMGL